MALVKSGLSVELQHGESVCTVLTCTVCDGGYDDNDDDDDGGKRSKRSNALLGSSVSILQLTINYCIAM